MSKEIGNKNIINQTAWILNYQNLNGGHEDVDDRFDL
jgi:hypothetical protein